MKNICILGSTGSIGTQSLDVIRNNSEMRVISLSAGGNIALLEEQAREFSPILVSINDEEKAKELKVRLADTSTLVVCGAEGNAEAACMKEVDIVLAAMVGIAGLYPTVRAIKEKKTIALANKETMVSAGAVVTKLAKENDVSILPVDSEHSAIFQCLQGAEHNEIEKILLTASGGPFRGKTLDELKHVTVAQALNHPNWDMGRRITIDSATMINKGLEVIEAKWLFDIAVSKIEVIVHPQSIVHSMVQFRDGAVIAQLGVPDMKLPIQYALTYPERKHMSDNRINFANQSLTFHQPDLETFFGLKMAFEAMKIGGVAPCVYNGADEAAVEAFLNGRIEFLDIARLVEKAVYDAPKVENPNLDDLYAADKWAREFVHKAEHSIV